ncbi:hypothetical protein AB7M37_006325 [Sinorhizobium fredii]
MTQNEWLIALGLAPPAITALVALLRELRNWRDGD